MARLNKYYESRSNDKRFKLLHEDASYLDILKHGGGLTEQDPDAEVVEETVLEDGQTLLNEEVEVTDEQIMAEWAKDNLDEISISIVRQTAKETAKKASKLRKVRRTSTLAPTGRKVRMGRV